MRVLPQELRPVVDPPLSSPPSIEAPMVATTPSSSCVLGTPPGELVLRVWGPGQAGEIVRLRSAKCSIGSGPQCTLRLVAAGVEPVHCVLLRGNQRTIARRWAPGPRLNGGVFADAELRPGDRLSIGPVELDVLETGLWLPGLETDSALPAAPEIDAHGAADTETRSLPAPQPDFPFPKESLREERANRQAEREDLQRRQAELAAEWERFRQEEAEWRHQQEVAERTLGEREEALDRRQSELDRRADETQQTRQAPQHSQEGGRCDQAIPPVARQEPPSPPEAERKGPEEAPRTQDLQPADLDAAWKAHDPIVGEEAVRAEAPVDLAGVLCRLGKADLLTADDREAPTHAGGQQESPPATPDAAATAATEEPPAGAGTAPQDAPAAKDEEVSIDEYMAQLMRRLRGETPVQGGAPDRESDLATKAPPQPALQEPAVRKPAVRKPRGPAPEQTGFAAMRELANVSARTAVEQSVRRRMRSMSRSKLVVAAAAGLMGLFLLLLWTTYAPFTVTLFAATTSFAVALLWTLQYAMVVGRALLGQDSLLRVGRSGETSTGAGAGAEAAAPDAPDPN